MTKIVYSLFIALSASCLFLPTTAAFSQAPLEKVFSESFDWGKGVEGRARVGAGISIDGARVMDSLLIWNLRNGRAVFGGSSGDGNGFLELGPSRNASISVPVAAGSAFKIELEAEVAFSDERSVSGLFLGFQSANPQNNLMHNQSSDRLYLRFNADGQIIMVSAGGELETQDRSASVPFNNGDRVRLQLELKRNANVVNGSIHNITRSVSTNVSIPFYGGNHLSELAINQTGHTDVKIFRVDFYQAR